MTARNELVIQTLQLCLPVERGRFRRMAGQEQRWKVGFLAHSQSLWFKNRTSNRQIDTLLMKYDLK